MSRPGVALSALSDVLNSEGATEAAAAAAILAQASGSAPPVALGDLFDLGPYSNQDHVSSGSGTSVSIGALDMVDATLTAAQGGRQLALNLSGSIPGLTNVTAFLAIGQRQVSSPWIGIDNAQNVIVSTAQTRLYIDTKVAPTSCLAHAAGRHPHRYSALC